MKWEKELELKVEELKEAHVNNEKLKEKVDSLLDVLYGCPECGLNSCECNDSDEYETTSPSKPSATPFEALSLPLSSPTKCETSPWTPPPTPPCKNCGGINFGPSPGSVCFVCVPPLQTTSPAYSSSPSRTPPGTPPGVS